MRPLVITAPSFDENNGGSIMLHQLADRCFKSGIEVYYEPIIFSAKQNVFNKFNENIPVVDDPSIYQSCIAVYPEIVDKNPLKAPYVVRWLLHRPGFINPNARMEKNETTFIVSKLHYKPAETHFLSLPQLHLSWVREELFLSEVVGDRVIPEAIFVHKGGKYHENIEINPSMIVLDRYSAIQKAEILKNTSILRCYDPHTFLLIQSVLAGCVPLVVPVGGISGSEWRAHCDFKHGIAYGEDELDIARASRDEFFDDLKTMKEKENLMVEQFLNIIGLKF